MSNRRAFLRTAIVTAASLPLTTRFALSAESGEDDVSPLEDLMREHGALNRVLLVYEECQRRVRARKDFDAGALNKGAQLIKTFIEGYHEKLEEEYLFPRLEKAGKLAQLCHTLKTQHDAGRKVTADLIALTQGSPRNGALERIDERITAFVRMYRPHEAFEDTVLFPAWKSLVPKKEYDELGERFEERERKVLGKDGFEGVLDQVTELEKHLGIHDIAQFTPKD